MNPNLDVVYSEAWLGRDTLGYDSGLVVGDDGSLTLLLGPDRPDGIPESNWLPTPAGRAFTTTNLRLYLPEAPVLDGTWVPPPLTRQE